MGCSETIYLIVQCNLSIVRKTNVIVEPVMFCFIIYCAAQLTIVRQQKIYCVVERDDCAAIKLLNNESGELYGFAVHVNLDRSSGKTRVL